MKIIASLVVMILILSACCKKDLAIGINMEYQNLEGSVNYAVLEVYGNEPEEKDTLFTGELNELNGYSFFLYIHNPELCYIVFADSSNFSDTISNISYEVTGFTCASRVEKFQYIHNGVCKTSNKLEIK